MISALCIRRPVMTILLMVSILAAASSPTGNCRGRRAARRFSHHSGLGHAAGGEPRNHGLFGCVDPREAVLKHRRRDLDDLDLLARRDLDR